MATDEYNRPRPPGWRGTVAVDFDGVIHQYTTRFEDATIIPDPPMPGAFEWLYDVVGHHDVAVFSARLNSPHPDRVIEVAGAMWDWFVRHGFRDALLGSRYAASRMMTTGEPIIFWLGRGKPIAGLYIDDRGYRFEGRFPTLEEIRNFQPWKPML